jgi:outer membrane cobalamin receptor
MNAQTATPTPNGTPKAKPVVVDVTAEGVPESASSASLVVLTRQEIENKHALDFADLLRDVPFLHVAQNGSRGSLTSATIRGGKPNFTLVLLDGTPINDISNVLGGSVDLSSRLPNPPRMLTSRVETSAPAGWDSICEAAAATTATDWPPLI